MYKPYQIDEFVLPNVSPLLKLITRSSESMITVYTPDISAAARLSQTSTHKKDNL